MENKKALSLSINTKKSLGIEFGSTRIKAVLIDENYAPLVSGSFDWENQLKDGIWTYDLNTVKTGLQICFQDLQVNFQNKFGSQLESIDSMGISAMMHGYLAFDKNNNLLVPFRTWRNTITAEAASELTALFSFNIPQR